MGRRVGVAVGHNVSLVSALLTAFHVIETATLRVARALFLALFNTPLVICLPLSVIVHSFPDAKEAEHTLHAHTVNAFFPGPRKRKFHFFERLGCDL